jgi:DNA-binding LacI/PurR family transcriptional regulator
VSSTAPSPSSGPSARRASGRPPTILDVAAQAGVSKSLVSRVLRGDGSVSASRREAVLAAVEALNYRPNAVARSLVQRRTFYVGVLVSDLHNLFFAEILDGIADTAREHGYTVLIATGNLDALYERDALEALLQLRTDGLILAGTELPDETVRTAGRTVPVALVTSTQRVAGVDTVATDDVRGAGLAVEHLVGLGHRWIALIDGAGGPGAAERRQGYEAAMRRSRLAHEIHIVRGNFTEQGGWAAMKHLLEEDPRVTAVCTGNDLAALGALNAIAEAGLDVPGDISVVGYDNTALAELRHVALTTVHQPRFEIGAMAMQAILRRIDNPQSRVRRELLEPKLIVRRTTAPPRA